MTSLHRGGPASTRSNQGSQGTQGACSGSLAGSDLPFGPGEDIISDAGLQIVEDENRLQVQESVIRDDGTMVASSVIEENKSED